MLLICITGEAVSRSEDSDRLFIYLFIYLSLKQGDSSILYFEVKGSGNPYLYQGEMTEWEDSIIWNLL